MQNQIQIVVLHSNGIIEMPSAVCCKMTILCFFRNNCENCFDRKNQFTVNPRRRWPPPQKLSTEHDGANGLRLRDLVYTEVGCARQSLKCGLVSVSLSSQTNYTKMADWV